MNVHTGWASVILCLADPAMALEIREGEFVYSSELLERGFSPFAVAGTADASYGLTDGTDLYMCFVHDTRERQSHRQGVLEAELDGESTSRTLPNIPVACILTQ